MRRSESYFESTDGLRLFHQEWTAHRPKATLVITHGLGEHSDCYEQFANEFKDYDLRIHAWDLRGHGRSQGVRGAISDLYAVAQDFEVFMKYVVKAHELSGPVILMGHSMGGLILLKSLLGLREYLEYPIILSSPFLGVALPVPAWKKSAAVLLAKVVPTLTLDNEIRPEDLVSDPVLWTAYRRDALRHHRISSGLYESAIEAIENVFFHAKTFQSPTLVIGSENDPVIDSHEVKNFAAHLKNATAHFYADRRHEVLNDSGREEVVAVVKTFIEEQAKLQVKRRPYL